MSNETSNKLAEAMAKAQAEMPVVKMNAQNPFLKNMYADLGAVIEASRPILAKHGLSLTQWPINDGDRIGVRSVLQHISGEKMESQIVLPVESGKGLSTAQSAGVILTYLRRYTWSAICGLYADEDADGHCERTDVQKSIAQHPTVKQSDEFVHKPGASKSTANMVTVVFERVNIKNGSKDGKAWTKYGAKGSDSVWYSTFDTEIGRCMQETVGTPILITFKKDDPKWGRDIESFMPCGKSEDGLIDDLPFDDSVDKDQCEGGF